MTARKRGRPPKTEVERTVKLRQISFFQEDFPAFEAKLALNGQSVTNFLRMVVKNYLRDEHLSLGHLPADHLAEVRAYALELFNDSTRIQSAIDSIVGQWVRSRAKSKG